MRAEALEMRQRDANTKCISARKFILTWQIIGLWSSDFTRHATQLVSELMALFCKVASNWPQ